MCHLLVKHTCLLPKHPYLLHRFSYTSKTGFRELNSPAASPKKTCNSCLIQISPSHGNHQLHLGCRLFRIVHLHH